MKQKKQKHHLVNLFKKLLKYCSIKYINAKINIFFIVSVPIRNMLSSRLVIFFGWSDILIKKYENKFKNRVVNIICK